MTKTVTIAATRTNGDPYAHHDVIVTLVAGSAGGVVGSNVIVSQTKVPLNASGEGSIVLATNDVEITSPSTSFYRFTVEGSSPTITRSVRITDALPSTISWTRSGIEVGDPTIPQRDVSSDYVQVGDQSLTNYLADLEAGGGGGAVDSVNGETGTVVLTASDVGADPAGTAAALTATDVGAATSADVAGAIAALDLGTAAQADASDFAPAGAIAALGLGTAATKNVAASGDAAAGEVVKGNDSRLSDPRAPSAHNHAASEIASGTLDIARIPTGATGTTVPFGNDSRFSDARTPTAHASSHARGGSDPVPVAVPGWGTGADGAVTISADTTITSNATAGFKHYTDLTVNVGVTLTVVGVIFVSGTLTVNGTISADGGNGSSTAGAAGGGGPGGTTGTLSGNGGPGGTNAGSVGFPTTNPASGLSIYGGGAGGAGGAGAFGAGGASGAVYAPASLFLEDGMLSLPPMWMNGLALARNAVMTLASGAGRGGGGGGGDGTNIGGGGGGGGGFLVVIARHVAGTGTIRANGGAGASRAVGNVAGGGGGGGGFLGLVTGDPSHGFTLQTNGGAGGTGNGTGGTGSAGATGHTRVIVGTT